MGIFLSFFPSFALPSKVDWDTQKNGFRKFGIRFTGDPCENRTRDTAVKGRCLNRLTNGPDLYKIC